MLHRDDFTNETAWLVYREMVADKFLSDFRKECSSKSTYCRGTPKSAQPLNNLRSKTKEISRKPRD